MKEGSDWWGGQRQGAAGDSGRFEVPGSSLVAWGVGPPGPGRRPSLWEARKDLLPRLPKEGTEPSFTPKSHHNDSSHVASLIFIGCVTTL